jgi:hypothetical protein
MDITLHELASVLSERYGAPTVLEHLLSATAGADVEVYAFERDV